MFVNQVVGIFVSPWCGGPGVKLNGLRRHGDCLVGSNMIAHTSVIKKAIHLVGQMATTHRTGEENSIYRFWRKLMAAWTP